MRSTWRRSCALVLLSVLVRVVEPMAPRFPPPRVVPQPRLPMARVLPQRVPAEAAIGRLLAAELWSLGYGMHATLTRPELSVDALLQECQRVSDWANARRPVVHWATGRWLTRYMVQPLGWWEPLLITPIPLPLGSPPPLGMALRSWPLQEELLRGIRRSPGRVFRLAWRALLLLLVARLPPGTLRARFLPALWPTAIEHYAATVERNMAHDFRLPSFPGGRRLRAAGHLLSPLRTLAMGINGAVRCARKMGAPPLRTLAAGVRVAVRGAGKVGAPPLRTFVVGLCVAGRCAGKLDAVRRRFAW